MSKGQEEEEPDSLVKYFSVVWCKASKKKHKKWEGDAVLIVKGKSFTLKDLEGKDIGRGIDITCCLRFRLKLVYIWGYIIKMIGFYKGLG